VQVSPGYDLPGQRHRRVGAHERGRDEADVRQVGGRADRLLNVFLGNKKVKHCFVRDFLFPYLNGF
jgi:hypothetical protein